MQPFIQPILSQIIDSCFYIPEMFSDFYYRKYPHKLLCLKTTYHLNTGSSRLMRISLLQFLLLRFFKTITIILLMQFYGLFTLLVRSLAKNLANAIFG